MVITDRFVYVHMPKTGGTFVTSVLFRIHKPARSLSSGQSLARRVFHYVQRRSQGRSEDASSPYGEITDIEPKHGTCSEIPPSHASKPILSTIRNPYDWYVSQYEFGWWKRTFVYHPESHPTPAGWAIEQVLPEFIQRHSHFPDIAFPEFVDLCSRAALVLKGHGTDLGLYSQSFLRFHYRHVPELVSRCNRDYFVSGRDELDRFPVSFLKTDRLNQELYDFLLSMGYHSEDLCFLPELGKILPMGRGRRDDQRWQNYYTPDLKRFIRETEWTLFDIFPEFDT